MRRIIIGLLIGGCALTTASAALAGSGRPVLGWRGAYPNGQGFGTAKPRVVFLGGDPTGYFSKLHWSHWGAARTVGSGRGWCPGASVAQGHYCSASLHVFDLATCHGRRAYLKVSFYFKPSAHERWMFGSTYNACTGP